MYNLKKLSFYNLPIIRNLDELSNETHLSKYTLYQLSMNSDFHYYTYTIPKKNGNERLINQPSRRLMGLQSWILRSILDKIYTSSGCKGFEKGTSIYDNAKVHIQANVVLTMDIKDFFSSINFDQVYNVYKIIGYNSLVSRIFTNICTYNNVLPQGSPCSPKLANLVCWQLDKRIQGYVGQLGIRYSRYADDLTFSGINPNRISKIIPFVSKIINDEGFQINSNKTRIAGPSRAKIVTGLIISGDRIGIGHKKYSELRAKIYHLIFSNKKEKIELFNEIKGWISYMNSVDKRRLIILKKYIEKLYKKNKGEDTLKELIQLLNDLNIKLEE